MSHAPELNALLSRGWTTREELLRTAFSGPVPGIAPDPNPVCFPLVFREMEEVYTKGAIAETLGNHLRFGKENDPHERATTLPLFFPTIRFRSDLAPDAFVGTVFAHEGFHVLQDEDLLTDALIAPHRAVKTIGASCSYGHGPQLEAVLAATETPEQTALRHTLLSKPYGEENTLPHLGNTNIYYLKHNEIESRMAQFFAACARLDGWKRMPQTRQELDQVLQIFNPHTAQGPHPRFPVKGLLLKEDVRKAVLDIRVQVVEKLSPVQRKAFFEKVLPEIYADFLERCGDLKIRSKLGLEPGIPYGRRAGRKLRSIVVPPNKNPVWTSAQWQKAAAEAEPETLPGLISLAIELGHNQAMPAFLKVYRQRPEFNPAALHTEAIRAKKYLLSRENRALLQEAAPQPKIPFHLPFFRHFAKPSPSTALEKSLI